MSHVVLGLHHSAPAGGRGYTSDGNVVLLVDGEPVFGVAQERVSRRKYDGGFADAARYSLERTGLEAGDVDAVAVSTFGRPVGDAGGVAEDVSGALGLDTDRVRPGVVPSHHLAHAAAAISQCEPGRRLVAVIDNEGSVLGPCASGSGLPMERTSYYLADGGTLRLVARDHDGPGEVGYGKVYSKVTRYIGFASYQESGKTMALAAFGDPDRFAAVPFFDECGDGVPRSTIANSEDGLRDLADHFRAHGVHLRPPRAAGDSIAPDHVDLAAWVQAGLERSVSRRLRGLARVHRVARFAGAGGVFLNSVLNARLRCELGTGDVFVPPSPGDQGLALGAAAWWCCRDTGELPRWGARPYLGGRFAGTDVRTALARHPELCGQRVDDPVGTVAEAVARGEVVGWFRDASEYGPRALGHRSILADPTRPWTREILNNQVKHREWFRPYAPAIRDEDVPLLFTTAYGAPHMMHTAQIRPAARARMPAGVHVDDSARLQTVSRDQDPVLHGLLARLHERHGLPAVINTSLNVDGMPMVEAPADALECLSRASGMSALVVGDVVVTRTGR